ncbi:Uma2 family endonuclease [Chloroflexi bacterium TSY]|nr:Uma2 family endonuclease [Chloroflexi bacterium TSY]
MATTTATQESTTESPAELNGRALDYALGIPAEDDPYRYGWREVLQTNEDGQEELVYIPLTLEDILHPEEDDRRLHARDHEEMCAYLNAAINAKYADDPHTFSLPDVRIDWNIPGVKAYTPDVAVVFNVREETNWTTFYVAEEGTKPSMVIEVTSPSTRDVDLITKKERYAQAGLPFYFIIDTIPRKIPVERRLIGYRLDEDQYVEIQPNEKGWLWMEPVGMWLGLDDTVIHCYEADGSIWRDYSELNKAFAESEKRAEQEAQRAEQEAQRAEQLAAHLRKLGIDPDAL